MQEDFTKEVKLKSKFFVNVYETLESIVMAIALVLIVFVFFAKLSVVDGDSMVPTLNDKEYLIVSNPFFSYEPDNGDIVVIQTTTTSSTGEKSPLTIVKRVIATGGQTVELEYGMFNQFNPTFNVYVDGVLVVENYAYYSGRPLPIRPSDVHPEFKTLSFEVPEGCVFVLGDNRNVSYDSRYDTLGEGGFIKESEIIGKVVFRILPLQKLGSIK